MTFRVSHGYWLLPICLLMGCVHKPTPPPPQTLAPVVQEQPKPTPDEDVSKNLPPPVLGDVTPTPAPQSAPEPPPEPVKKPMHKAKKLNPATEAENATTPSVSAIGQLSSGGSGDQRTQTINSIAAIEKKLNGITRSMSAGEQRTATQIREFLKEAKDALASGDMDGAHTLTEKAKILLSELNP